MHVELGDVCAEHFFKVTKTRRKLTKLFFCGRVESLQAGTNVIILAISL